VDTNSMARWIVDTMPTLPRSTCARACEGLEGRRVWRAGGDSLHETA